MNSETSTPEDSTTRIRRRRLEWRIAAAVGLAVYAVAFFAVRQSLSVGSSAAIYWLLLPLIVSVLVKGRMQAVNKEVDEILKSAATPRRGTADYAAKYEQLIDSPDPSHMPVARRFRRIELYWTGSSFYVLAAIVAILLNFILSRSAS